MFYLFFKLNVVQWKLLVVIVLTAYMDPSYKNGSHDCLFEDSVQREHLWLSWNDDAWSRNVNASLGGPLVR